MYIHACMHRAACQMRIRICWLGGHVLGNGISAVKQEMYVCMYVCVYCDYHVESYGCSHVACLYVCKVCRFQT